MLEKTTYIILSPAGDHNSHVLALMTECNKIARTNGFGRATDFKREGFNGIVSSIAYGYRKYTTGEYVTAAYRANFGWKNTYYQHARCVVSII